MRIVFHVALFHLSLKLKNRISRLKKRKPDFTMVKTFKIFKQSFILIESDTINKS